MLFALDGHAIGRHLTGNEVYARNLLNGLSSLGEGDEFIAYVSVKQAQKWIPAGCRIRQVSPNPYLRLGFDLAAKLRSDAPRLVHVQYTAPVGCPVPVVVSVHDVSFLEHPEYFPRLRAAQLRWTVSRTVHSAARVLTGSDFSRSSILRAYPRLEPDKVVVVPNAASDSFRPVSREAAAAFTRRRFGLAAPYVLTVGDLQPRKNHVGLIAAFSKLLAERPGLPHDLVLAGKDTWFSARVHEAALASGVAERIRFTGFVSDEELLQLYTGCEAFVFPSFYEGFGLPLLEAMACARAVACSRTSAMTEVADGAALLFDPYATAEITRAMADLLRDAELRARMERLGTQRSAAFSWKRTAAQTLAIYREVAAGAAPAARRLFPAQTARS